MFVHTTKFTTDQIKLTAAAAAANSSQSNISKILHLKSQLLRIQKQKEKNKTQAKNYLALILAIK